MRVYEPTGPNSYILDAARRSIPEGMLDPGVVKRATDRLNAHGEEVREEIRKGSPEGRAALAQMCESVRSGNIEQNLRQWEEIQNRAATDSTIVGFSTPQYIEAIWAPFRSPVSAFADSAQHLPLPPVGLQIHAPAFTSTSSYTQQSTENTGTANSSPSGAYFQDPINIDTFSGTIIVSQQLMDRGGYDGQGGTFDQIAAMQLAEQAKADWDAFVIVQALATATTVTQAATLTVPLLLTNLSKGRENMANAAGFNGRATHIWSTENLSEWLFDQVDSSQRPIITPDPASLIATDPVGQPVVNNTFTGVWLNRQGLWSDDNIPLVSTNQQQVILADMREVFCWAGSPQVVAYPEPNASELSVVIRSHFYGAAAVRYAAAVQQLTGAGYANLS